VDPAPLLDLPGAPVPAGGQAEWFTGLDGARLRAALFPPTAPARGSVVLSPGRTEPLEKYFEVIGELQARGFTVLVHDWRGQGLSARWLADRQKSHARGWRPFLSDFRRLLDAFEARLPKPWIALAHSMGGGLTLLALAEGERRFSACVLSSPMLGVQLDGFPEPLVRSLSWFMTLIGRAGAYVYPEPIRRAEVIEKGPLLTHDTARRARYMAQLAAEPDLKVDGVTWGWLSFALALTLRIEKLPGMERIDIPVICVAAEDDHFCTTPPQRAAIARAPHGRYVPVEGAYHEVLMELDARRAVFWAAFDEVVGEVG